MEIEKLDKTNIKSRINKMITTARDNNHSAKKFCIFLHPNQFEDFKNSTEVDLVIIEKIRIYDITKFIALMDENKIINEFEGKMLLTGDKGKKYYNNLIDFALSFKKYI